MCVCLRLWRKIAFFILVYAQKEQQKTTENNEKRSRHNFLRLLTNFLIPPMTFQIMLHLINFLCFLIIYVTLIANFKFKKNFLKDVS